MGYRNVAGLWKEDLIAGLLWSRKAVAMDVLPPESSNLLSWSWACFSGQVSFWRDMHSGLQFLDSECEVIDLSYQTTDGLGSYGEIINARIQMKGRLLPVFFASVKPAEYCYGLPREYVSTKNGIRIGSLLLDRADSHRSGPRVFCLLIHQGSQNPAGLLLEQVEGRSNEYKRMGYTALRDKLIDAEDDFRNAFSEITPETFALV